MASTRVIFVNDSTDGLVVKYSDNGHMAYTNEFPKTVEVSPGEQRIGGIASASLSLYDHIFYLNLNGDPPISVNLGVSSTTATVDKSAEGRVACLIAPLFFEVTDSSWPSWETWCFNGPGVMTPLGNSLISANMSAITASIAMHGLKIDFGSGWVLNLGRLATTGFQCKYAGISPMFNAKPGIYTFTILLSADTVGVTGMISKGGHDIPLNFNLSNAMVCTSIVLNTNLDAGVQPPVMTMLKCSLGGVSFLDTTILDYMFPPSSHPAASKDSASASTGKEGDGTPKSTGKEPGDTIPNHIAEWVNDEKYGQNKTILFYVNKYLAGLIPTKPINLGPPLPAAPSDHPEPHKATSGITRDPKTWMTSTDILTQKQLIDLKIPATHDSGTFWLSSTLSQMKYGDIAFLWGLSPATAPVDGKWPLPSLDIILAGSGPPLYVGQPLYDFIMDPCVNSMSRAQPQTITEQLNNGIRWFDLRVYLDTRPGGGLYTQHALRGFDIKTLLNQFLNFMLSCGGTELIFVGLNALNFNAELDGINQLTQLIQLVFKDHPELILFLPDGVPGTEPYLWEQLKYAHIGDLVGTTSKIIFMNWITGNPKYDVWFPNAGKVVTNINPIRGPGGDDPTDLDSLWKHEGEGITANGEINDYDFYSMSWTLGLNLRLILQSTLPLLQGIPNVWALRDLAAALNAHLPAFWKQYPYKWNVCSMDWPQNVDGPSLTQQVIEMNFSG